MKTKKTKRTRFRPNPVSHAREVAVDMFLIAMVFTGMYVTARAIGAATGTALGKAV
jgi:uncharacterized membrane protein (DUF485 family)